MNPAGLAAGQYIRAAVLVDSAAVLGFASNQSAGGFGSFLGETNEVAFAATSVDIMVSPIQNYLGIPVD